MKVLQRRAHLRCPIKRHDVKWPCDAPVVSFLRAPVFAAGVPVSAFGRSLILQFKFEPDVEDLSRGSGQSRCHIAEKGAA
jgi:hypothetical protein